MLDSPAILTNISHTPRNNLHVATTVTVETSWKWFMTIYIYCKNGNVVGFSKFDLWCWWRSHRHLRQRQRILLHPPRTWMGHRLFKSVWKVVELHGKLYDGMMVDVDLYHAFWFRTVWHLGVLSLGVPAAINAALLFIMAILLLTWTLSIVLLAETKNEFLRWIILVVNHNRLIFHNRWHVKPKTFRITHLVRKRPWNRKLQPLP